MKKKKWLILLGLCSTLMLSGCGSSASYGGARTMDDLGGVNFAESKAVYNDSYDGVDEYSSSEADIVKSNMMIAKTVYLSADVENLETFDTNVHDTVEKFDGYFEESTINDYDSEWSTQRNSRYRIRIPSKNLDAFLEIMEGTSFLTSKSVNSEDVSLEYVDVEAHIKALEDEKASLERLMDSAETVEDIIDIQDRLSSVQAQLDSYNGQKRLLEGRVSYSTVNLDAYEERNVEHPIRKAFEVNFKERALEGIESAVEVFVGIIAAIPVIIIVTGFAILFIWLLRKIWRKVFKTDKHHIRYMWMPVEVTPEAKQQTPVKKDDAVNMVVDSKKE